MIWLVVIVFVGLLVFGTIRTLRLVDWSPPWRRPPPVVDVGDELPDGTLVTLTGSVRLVGEPLISPISAVRCVLYETYANLYEEAKQGDDDKKVLSGQLAEAKMVPFELVTSIGIVLIDATEADTELVPTPIFPRRPEREARFLRQNDRDERLIEMATFEETTVDPDSLISVRGRVAIAGDKLRLVADGETLLVVGVPRKLSVER